MICHTRTLHILKYDLVTFCWEKDEQMTILRNWPRSFKKLLTDQALTRPLSNNSNPTATTKMKRQILSND